MLSQPYELTREEIESGTRSADPKRVQYTTIGFISPAEAEEKRREFELNLPNYISLIESTLTNDTPDATQDATPEQITEALHDLSTIKFYYFIGRCNPPHNGHIEALIQLCELAKASEIPALILLGSGPQGERMSFSNPLNFQTKANFIRQHLSGFIEGQDYVIQEMENPYKNVPEYVATGLGNIVYTTNSIGPIQVTQLAGDKGDDTTKLKGVLTAVEKKIKPILEAKRVTFSGEVIAVESVGSSSAEIPMSATEVRKTAFDSYVKADFNIDTGFKMWPEQFKHFYGPQMYEAIVQPVVDLRKNLNPDETKQAVEDYLVNDRLPSSLQKVMKESSKRKRGGGSKRRPNKTQKRRKRRTRRRR